MMIIAKIMMIINIIHTNYYCNNSRDYMKPFGPLCENISEFPPCSMETCELVSNLPPTCDFDNCKVPESLPDVNLKS